MLYLLIFVVAIFTIGYFIFKYVPQFGAVSTGERKQKVEASPNYRDGKFQNPVETTMERPPMSVLFEMMKNDSSRQPSKPIKNLAIDREKFEKTKPNEVLFTWLGHSTLLLKIDGKTILTDPVFSERASSFEFAGPKKFPYEIEYQIDNLPKIDYVLISHDHYDHLDYQFILKMKDKVAKFIAPLGVGAHLEHWGVKAENIIELDWWEQTQQSTIKFTAAPSRHFTGRKFSDRFQSLWCGWAIESNANKLYFTGDSGYFNGFKEIGDRLGPFDMAFIECGQYNEAWENIHMMPEQSVLAAKDLRAKIALPIHWGKFKLSIHPWTESPERFTAEAKKLGVKYTLPNIGESFTIDQFPTTQWWKK